MNRLEHPGQRMTAVGLPTVQLVAYIVRTYHEPVRNELPNLQLLAIHAAHAPGLRFAVLDGVASTATDLLDATFAYLDEYDREIFPVFVGRRAASHGFHRTLVRVQDRAYEILRLVLRIQRGVSWLRASVDVTAVQRELLTSVDGVAAHLNAQVELETVLLGRAA